MFNHLYHIARLTQGYDVPRFDAQTAWDSLTEDEKINFQIAVEYGDDEKAFTKYLYTAIQNAIAQCGVYVFSYEEPREIGGERESVMVYALSFKDALERIYGNYGVSDIFKACIKDDPYYYYDGFLSPNLGNMLVF